jgi:hypothetical protein
METLSTNEQKVLDYIKSIGSLTTLEAVTSLHIMNVQDVIMRLRKKGYNIQKVWKTSPNKKRFAIYSLIK